MDYKAEYTGIATLNPKHFIQSLDMAALQAHYCDDHGCTSLDAQGRDCRERQDSLLGFRD